MDIQDDLISQLISKHTVRFIRLTSTRDMRIFTHISI